jgi:glycosyltransferase involved in cell wall biosynthesis
MAGSSPRFFDASTLRRFDFLMIAVLAPEPIRPRMAGMGIRALELARALSREHATRLLVPNDPEEARGPAGDLEVVGAPAGRLAEAARGCSAAVVSGHAANSWFHEVPGLPVAVDLYDPFPIENLHYARTLGEGTARHDLATLSLALSRGDFFLCASAEQRLFYAGALFAQGRIGGTNFPDDPALRNLLATVPFGVPETPAAGDRAAGRRAAGVAEAGPLVLFGGIYDWYDPELLLAAWPRVRERVAGARLLFFENPNPETTPQGVFEAARAIAKRIDPAGRSIRFSPWLPYASRADLYAACDLAVSIASEGLETELAYRTRLLDAAWGGVPSVAVAGGTLGRELAEAGAGLECPRAEGALAAAISDLLADAPRRERMARAARSFASQRTWGSVAAPLLRWAKRARIDPGRLELRAAGAAGGGSLLSRIFR